MTQKEDFDFEAFLKSPKRKLSDEEKQFIFLAIERSRVKRERSFALLDKGVLIFFALLMLISISRINDVLPAAYLDTLFILAIAVFIVVIVIYERDMAEEQKRLDKLFDTFMR